MININDGFNIGAATALDSRTVLTKAEMFNINDSIMPSVYFCTCKDDGMFYLYNKSNAKDAETGRFRVIKAEGGALVFTKAEWDALENKPADGTQVIITDDISGYNDSIVNTSFNHYGLNNQFNGNLTSSYTTSDSTGEIIEDARYSLLDEYEIGNNFTISCNKEMRVVRFSFYDKDHKHIVTGYRQNLYEYHHDIPNMKPYTTIKYVRLSISLQAEEVLNANDIVLFTTGDTIENIIEDIKEVKNINNTLDILKYGEQSGSSNIFKMNPVSAWQCDYTIDSNDKITLTSTATTGVSYIRLGRLQLKANVEYTFNIIEKTGSLSGVNLLANDDSAIAYLGISTNTFTPIEDMIANILVYVNIGNTCSLKLMVTTDGIHTEYKPYIDSNKQLTDNTLWAEKFWCKDNGILNANNMINPRYRYTANNADVTSLTNWPVANAGTILCLKTAFGYTQIFVHHLNSQMKIRTYYDYNKIWSPWKEFAGKGANEPFDITYTTNFVNTGSFTGLQCYQNDNTVTVSCWSSTALKLGTKSGYASVGTLPSGYRPKKALIHYILINGSYLGQVVVEENGLVKLGYTRTIGGTATEDLPAGQDCYFTLTFAI